jgi:hypothetical protein
VALSKGDVATYTGLAAVATLEAYEPFRKEAAIPPESHPILAHNLWNYVPIILLSLIALLWLWGFLTARWRPQIQKRELPIPSIDFPTPDWVKPLTPVINKKYKNETVELDGKEFQHCEFQDVTFLWNGTRQTRFVNCKRTGKPGQYSFQSYNPLVFGTLQIANTLEVASAGEGKIEWTLFDGSPR